MGSPGDDVAKGRSEQAALRLIWGVIIAIGFLIFLFGQYQGGQAKASLDWPVTSGEILVSKVTTSRTEEGITESADIKYSYTVAGQKYYSNVVVIGGHDYRPADVVNRYSVGNVVSVAYDPGKPRKAVLEPGKFTFGYQNLGKIVMGGALFMALLIDFIFRRSFNEELNLLDHVIIFSCKVFFFPLWYFRENLWVVGLIVGLAGWLSTLDANSVITVPLMFFSAFNGVLGLLLLWCCFMGWLLSFQDDGLDEENGCDEEDGSIEAS